MPFFLPLLQAWCLLPFSVCLSVCLHLSITFKLRFLYLSAFKFNRSLSPSSALFSTSFLIRPLSHHLLSLLPPFISPTPFPIPPIKRLLILLFLSTNQTFLSSSSFLPPSSSPPPTHVFLPPLPPPLSLSLSVYHSVNQHRYPFE